jgi:hypothetical protein
MFTHKADGNGSMLQYGGGAAAAAVVVEKVASNELVRSFEAKST